MVATSPKGHTGDPQRWLLAQSWGRKVDWPFSLNHEQTTLVWWVTLQAGATFHHGSWMKASKCLPWVHQLHQKWQMSLFPSNIPGNIKTESQGNGQCFQMPPGCPRVPSHGWHLNETFHQGPWLSGCSHRGGLLEPLITLFGWRPGHVGWLRSPNSLNCPKTSANINFQ